MGIINRRRDEAEPRRKRKIAAAGLAAIAVSSLTVGAFSLYSQSNSVTSDYSAASWGIMLNDVPVDGTEPEINIGDGLGLMPGMAAHTQARFTNTGSFPVVIDLESVTGTGALGEYLDVRAVAVTSLTAGTFGFGECVESAGTPGTYVPASEWNFPAWVAPAEPAASAVECEAGYQSATIATASTFQDGVVASPFGLMIFAGETVSVNFEVTLQEGTTFEQASGATANAVAKFNLSQAALGGDNVGLGDYKEAFGTRDVYQP
ncbi:MAG: hypothetical protein WED09_05460 [Homoserinimonas sp.]